MGLSESESDTPDLEARNHLLDSEYSATATFECEMVTPKCQC